MTPLQAKALGFIRDEIERFGQAPTYQEIADRLAVVSKGRAWAVVGALVEQGRLIRTGDAQRALALPDTPDLRGVGSELLRAELARRGFTLDSLAVPKPLARGRTAGCAHDMCRVAVEPGQLFCRDHWCALPAWLQWKIKAANARRDVTGYRERIEEARALLSGAAR